MWNPVCPELPLEGLSPAPKFTHSPGVATAQSMLRRSISMPFATAWLILPFMAHATAVNPDAAHGRKVLYVYNDTKLKKARAADPADLKRVAKLATWRDNDEKTMAYLRSLGFVVTAVDEASPLEATRNQDLVIISESVDAIDVGAKYRDITIPLLTFENDLLGAGLQNVLADEHCKMNWGKPGLGAITITTLRGEPDKAALFACEKGATLNGEFLAPARRVSFFLWQDTFDPLRPEGLALFRAAVLWSVTTPE